jgi:hypothetical protein
MGLSDRVGESRFGVTKMGATELGVPREWIGRDGWERALRKR